LDDKKKLLEEDIVTMLDHFMSKGGGHMNVEVDAFHQNLAKQVKEMKSSDCNSKNMACQVPTLFAETDEEQENLTK